MSGTLSPLVEIPSTWSISCQLIAVEHIRKKRNYLAMSLWIFLGFLYVSVVSQWITINNRDRSLTDYIDHVLHEQRSAKETRALILIKAGDLLLPVQGDEIQINGNGQTLRAAVHYKAEISLPIVNRPVYRMNFQHNLAAQ